MPSAPEAIWDASRRYGFAAGSPTRFSMWQAGDPGSPITRSSAPRFSIAHTTRSGANESGR